MSLDVAFGSPLPDVGLASGRIVLRPFAIDDLSLVEEASNDPFIPTLTTVPDQYTAEEGRAFIDRQNFRRSSGEGWSLAIVDAATDRAIGQIGLWIAHLHKGRAEIGYWIANSGRGAGAAAEAVTMLSDWAFEQLDVDRLSLFIEPWNAPSLRTAERAGYQREARLRQWERVAGGARDMWSYVRTRDEPLSAAVAAVLDQIGAHRGERCLVAIDGRSAAGKSTLTSSIAEIIGHASVVRGDDFYRVMDDDRRFALAPAEGVAQDFDWQRLRSAALEPLRAGEAASYARYDWSTGTLGAIVTVPASTIVIAEGVYMSRPELRDLFDVTVFVDTAQPVRDSRQAARGDSSAWIDRWHAAEDHYVASFDPAARADVVVSGAQLTA